MSIYLKDYNTINIGIYLLAINAVCARLLQNLNKYKLNCELKKMFIESQYNIMFST